MILITGAAGYIGSHTLHQLSKNGEKIIAVDNLYSGHREAIPTNVPLFVGNAGDRAFMEPLMKEHAVDAVIHFAAHLEVEESTQNPLKYYRNNFVNSMNLIELCNDLQVKHFIFSSTCAVYGTPASSPVREECPTAPINPYGASKLSTERLLQDLELAKVGPLKHVILRYFNVAGAQVSGQLGQSTPRATQLIKVASEVACGKRSAMHLYGNDYPTPDGTCVRDYIHVDDLAHAHILALNYLRNHGKSNILNCGYGTGFSVKQVIDAMKRVSGIDFPVEIKSRRAGDAVSVFADPTHIQKTLSWKPEFADLDLICRTALNWEKHRKF